MTEDAQRRRRKRQRLWLALAVAAAALAALLVPPMVSIGRYKSRITELVSESLGRPVRLASVQMRLLPRPGFVLTDLTVEEDPAYGAEPVLHANTVTADIRLLSLWRGRLAISSISVDEASLNVVRTREGRWNLDPLFRTAAAHSERGQEGKVQALPYLEATNSRVNIKNGLEKLPFSLVDADLSFWQAKPGEWHVRLRGQPARTDVSLDLADTGVVQLEASLRRAPELRRMPLHLDMEWRDAQLGQLSRLLVGSDPGWRGDLRGEMHLDGTADAAQVKIRLRATGVHRAEFAPVDALDFDANCGFVYHYSRRNLEDLACDSPLGDGHIRVNGGLQGGVATQLSVELQRIPVQAGLDLLRTLRSGIEDGLEAEGTVSGKLTYDRAAVAAPVPAARHGKIQPAKAHPVAEGPLRGSLTVLGLKLSGGGLGKPIEVAKISVEPSAVTAGQTQALTAALALPAGGPAPLAVTVQLGLSGYQVTLRGPAALARMREMAQVAGIADTAGLGAIAGDPATLDLSAEGPWLPTPKTLFSRVESRVEPAGAEPIAGAPEAVEEAASDQLSGTVTLHDANWKPDALAGHVEIAQATLHLGGEALVWDPVVFSYGPVKGTASLQVPLDCAPEAPCPPRLEMHFAELDAGKLQAALLGAEKPNTLLSTLLKNLTTSKPAAWPRIDAGVRADALALGPVTLRDAAATLRILPAGAELTSFNAGVLGGKIHATGTLTQGEKPAYALDGDFEELNGAAVCQLLGLRCRGGAVEGNGKVELSGFTDKDLASSAKGTLHFEWRRGAIERAKGSEVPAALARFDHWTADGAIGNGAVTLSGSQVQQARRKSAVEAAVTFGDPPKVTFAATPPAQAAKR